MAWTHSFYSTIGFITCLDISVCSSRYWNLYLFANCGFCCAEQSVHSSILGMVLCPRSPLLGSMRSNRCAVVDSCVCLVGCSGGVVAVPGLPPRDAGRSYLDLARRRQRRPRRCTYAFPGYCRLAHPQSSATSASTCNHSRVKMTCFLFESVPKAKESPVRSNRTVLAIPAHSNFLAVASTRRPRCWHQCHVALCTEHAAAAASCCRHGILLPQLHAVLAARNPNMPSRLLFSAVKDHVFSTCKCLKNSQFLSHAWSIG